MWASRAHGMTYDRTERQQNRRTTWASRANSMTQDINRTERPQDTETTGKKDNRIGRQHHRKTIVHTNTDNSTGRQQGRKRYVLLYYFTVNKLYKMKLVQSEIHELINITLM